MGASKIEAFQLDVTSMAWMGPAKDASVFDAQAQGNLWTRRANTKKEIRVAYLYFNSSSTFADVLLVMTAS